VGHAAQLHHALGEIVDVVLHRLGDLVEQLVESDERGALHVPVGLLELRLEVDRVRKPRIEQIDDLRADGAGQIVAGAVHAGLRVSGVEPDRGHPHGVGSSRRGDRRARSILPGRAIRRDRAVSRRRAARES
jgi:hypothetical protein